jgi:hypothetical protein
MKLLRAMLRIRRSSTSNWLVKAAGGLCVRLVLGGMLASAAMGQACRTGEDLEAPVRAKLEAAAAKYFDLAVKGDVAGLKASAIPSVAGDFSGIAAAVRENQPSFAKAQAVVRSTFELIAEGDAPLERAEFLCGVFGKTGQTSSSAEFVLNALPPGQYAIVILDVSNKAAPDDGPYAVAFVLQQAEADWKLGGFQVKDTRSAGRDSTWFAEQARAFAAKSEMHNAWYYFLQARNLATVVPFMSTRATDRLYDEAQRIAPADGLDGVPKELTWGGKSYKVKSAFAYGVAGEINLVVKFECPDVSDAARSVAENQAVARALVTKWPELRDGFTAIEARATDASGRDFGTLVMLKDLK